MKNSIFLILLLFLTTTSHALASSQFALDASTEYVFSQKGDADVKKTIQLTNLTTNVYPSVYFHDLPEDASNVIAVNDSGKLNAGVTFENGVKQVKLPIKQESFGFNKSIKFIISYETRSLAQKKDEFWTVRIPAFNVGEDITRYEVSVALPESWGTPTLMSPEPSQPFIWTYEQVGNNPIVISYEPQPTEAPVVSETTTSFNPYIAGVVGGSAVLGILYIIMKKLSA